MTTPVTTLDQRYSDPDAVATEWDETRRVLESAEVFWISTVRADGRPHVTPCVAVWLDGTVYFDTGATQEKAINVSANPHVILTTGRFRFLVRDGCFYHDQDEVFPAVLVFSVTPTQILAFTRGALGGHTTHRF